MALYKTSRCPRTARIKSLLSQLLVTLHRPLPVIRTCGRAYCFSPAPPPASPPGGKTGAEQAGSSPPMITASKWFCH